MAETLNCQELVELITDYLEGSLSPGERARFEAHLAECDGCSNYLAQMRKTIALVGHLAQDAIPEGSKQELLRLFRDWKKSKHP